jgi:uncharacterized protein
VVTPVLYDVTIRHERLHLLRRSFTHRSYVWLVDLDVLPRLPWWLRPFARFEAADHLGGSSLRAGLDAWLAERGVDLGGGRVLMLANARTGGHVFNPLTLYWCHGPDGEQVCVVAEVHNTYGGRHGYLLRPDARGSAEVDKAFFVSPFLAVDGTYTMQVPPPGERLTVAVTLRQGGRTAFAASLNGRRRPATPRHVAGTVVRWPWVTVRVSGLIRAHGIALWLRRLPVVPRRRSDRRPEETHR